MNNNEKTDMKAAIGDTVRTKMGNEFIVRNQETDEEGIQWVWTYSEEAYKEWGDDVYFLPGSYSVPSTNFTIIKRG